MKQQISILLVSISALFIATSAMAAKTEDVVTFRLMGFNYDSRRLVMDKKTNTTTFKVYETDKGKFTGQVQLTDEIVSAEYDKVPGVHTSKRYTAGDFSKYVSGTGTNSYVIVGNKLIVLYRSGAYYQTNFPAFSLINKRTEFQVLSLIQNDSMSEMLWVNDPDPRLRGTYILERSNDKYDFKRYKERHPMFDAFDNFKGTAVDQVAVDRITRTPEYQEKSKVFYANKAPANVRVNEPVVEKTKSKIQAAVASVPKVKLKKSVEVSATGTEQAKITTTRNHAIRTREFLKKVEQAKLFAEGSKNSPLVDFLTTHFEIVYDVPAAEPEEYRAQKENLDIGVAGIRADGGSVKIIGKPGTGKSYLTELLLSHIVNNDVPSAVKERIYIRLNADTLLADAGYIGPFNSKVDALKKLSRVVPVTLIIEEMHTLVGAGTHKYDQNDFYQRLLTEMQDGRIKIIGNTTTDEYNRLMGANAAMERRFPVTLTPKELSREETIRLLETYQQREVRKLNASASIEPGVFEYILDLSERIDPISAQPDKALSLLKFFIAMTPGESFDLNRTNIDKIASKKYGFDITQFSPEKMSDKLADLKKQLNASHMGQSEAKETIELFLNGHYLNQIINNESRPGSILLYGPRGTGKTTLAESMGNGLGRPTKEILMSRFSGNNVDEFRTEVALAVKSNPFSVIVFDEIEKASADVQKAALDIIQKGKFTARLSQAANYNVASEVNAVNVIFVGTTNAGQELAGTSHSVEDFQQATERLLDPYLTDRFLAFVPVRSATDNELKEIVLSTWRGYDENLKKAGIRVNVNPEQMAHYIVTKLNLSSSGRAGSIGFLAASKVTEGSTEHISIRAVQREFATVWQHLSRFITYNKNEKDISLKFNDPSLPMGDGIIVKPNAKSRAANSCRVFYSGK